MDYSIFENMLPSELEDLIAFLNELLGNAIAKPDTITKVIHKENNDFCCPNCNSSHVVKNGHNKSHIQKYKCNECGKYFTDATGTIVCGTKLTFEKWKLFIECMINKFSIRKTAEMVGVNKNTAFAMRHKVMEALSVFRKDIKLIGEVQLDEKYESINLKGTRKEKMPRASKPRKSKGNSTQGISSHKVCIASAIDETDQILLKVVGNGQITSKMVEDTFIDKIDKHNIMITDCKSSYEDFAHKKNIKLEQVKSGTYANNNGYNLSEINGLHSNLDLFMKSFRGVSTKHLPEYLNWFIYQKYLTYTLEVLEHPEALLNFAIIQRKSITVDGIYAKDFPIDIYKIYEEYHYTPSVIS